MHVGEFGIKQYPRSLGAVLLVWALSPSRRASEPHRLERSFAAAAVLPTLPGEALG